MSGAACSLASSKTTSQPLSAQVFLNTGATNWDVSGASGNLYTAFGVVLVIIDSGGVSPYSAGSGDGLKADGSFGSGNAAMSVVAAGDGVHNTLKWSGMDVGDYVLAHFVHSIKDSDSPQSSASDRLPESGSLMIHRVS